MTQVSTELTDHLPKVFNDLFSFAEYFAQEIMATESFRHENKDNSFFVVCLKNGELSTELEDLVDCWLDSVADYTEQDDLSITINHWKVPKETAL